MFGNIKRDIKAALERDPAARNALEVFLCYPGLHALFFYRASHWLWRHKFRLLGRLVSHLGRFFTGIEIHPGAKIKPGLFIDHGMGVVIGETSEIGENVTLYQGVTLGGSGLGKLSKGKRHPTLGNNVVVGVDAQILGPHKIGDNTRVGAGSVVINDVPPNCLVVGVPGKVIYRDGKRVDRIDLEHDQLPDPIVKAIEHLDEKVRTLENELAQLKASKSGNKLIVDS
jgi:serine O-acetyltransferase